MNAQLKVLSESSFGENVSWLFPHHSLSDEFDGAKLHFTEMM